MFEKALAFVREYVAILIAVGVVLVLILIGVGVRRSLPPTEFTIAAGREGGGYYRAAQAYQTFAAQHNFTVHLRPTAGAVEAMDLLTRGEVDVAFVQSGTARDADPARFNMLAAIYYEPLWIFYRRDAAGDTPLTQLNQLEGLRLAIGEPGSGAHALAQELLTANGVTAANTTFVETPFADGAAQLQAGEVDALLTVIAADSTLVAELLHDPALDLMSVANAEAYRSLYPYLVDVELAPGTYGLAENVPREPKTLLSAVATLVIPSDFHPDLIRLLLYAATAEHADGGVFERPNDFPNTLYGDLPINQVAQAYYYQLRSEGPPAYDRFFPFRISALLQRYEIFLLPLLLLLIPMLARTPLVYQFGNRYRIFRWYRKVRAIERDMAGMDLARTEEALARLEELQRELNYRINVGIFFMQEMYNLRMHVEFVSVRLRRHRNALLAEAGLPVPDDLAEDSGLVIA